MTSGIIFFFLGLIPLGFIIAFSGLDLGIIFFLLGIGATSFYYSFLKFIIRDSARGYMF